MSCLLRSSMDLPVGMHVTYRNVAPIIFRWSDTISHDNWNVCFKNYPQIKFFTFQFFIIFLDLGRNRQTRLRAYIQRTYLHITRYFVVYIVRKTMNFNFETIDNSSVVIASATSTKCREYQNDNRDKFHLHYVCNVYIINSFDKLKTNTIVFVWVLLITHLKYIVSVNINKCTLKLIGVYRWQRVTDGYLLIKCCRLNFMIIMLLLTFYKNFLKYL